jgi:hypothetical protein
MTSLHSYIFNNLGSISSDNTDQSQRNVYNTRFTNYTLSNYFSDSNNDNHINFATEQPTVMFSGTSQGQGLNGSVIDDDSNLLLNKEQNQHILEKLQLNQRPFLTVPYLGRGSCDTNLESQLLQGEIVSDKKSVSTIMENSFNDYSLLILDDNMNERVKNDSYMVEESALNGWIRGGTSTREMSSDEYMKANNRPSGSY